MLKKILFNITLICLIGIITGIMGGLLALLLKAVQHLAYGYDLDSLMGGETFLQGVYGTPPLTRFKILLCCGVVAGGGWWLLYRYLKPIISIEKSVEEKKLMPISTTLCHALLQIITVGLGSPLGREKAPREVAACLTGHLVHLTKQNDLMTRHCVASAAGAGLAAIYNIPLAGALYTLEHLLKSWHWSAVIPAVLTSGIAVIISWMILGNVQQFHIPIVTLDPMLILWAICVGPFLGCLAFWFNRALNEAHRKMKTNWQLPLFCMLNFLLIAGVAIYLPVLLGNGKSVVQVEFLDANTLSLALILFALRFFITWSSFRAGADGGSLTPSLANGALLGVILGHLWNLLFTNVDLSLCAILGGVAFLAAAQKIPLTAIALIFEFTHLRFEFIAPLLLIIGGALIGVKKGRILF